VRKAERAWFLFEGKESEALGINGARPTTVRLLNFEIILTPINTLVYGRFSP